MIRWIDLIGLAGFAIVVFATQLLFPGSAERMNWKDWLGGAALWFAGFAAVVGWLLLRWSVRPLQERRLATPIWPLRKSQPKEVTFTMKKSA